MCDAGMPWLVVTIVGTFIVILCELKKLDVISNEFVESYAKYEESVRLSAAA